MLSVGALRSTSERSITDIIDAGLSVFDRAAQWTRDEMHDEPQKQETANVSSLVTRRVKHLNKT